MGIKKIRNSIFYFLLLCAFQMPYLSHAQGIENTPIEKINGKKYYLHTVNQGQTLYAISKLYSVSIEDIVAENPTVESGLQVLQVIKIPIDKIDKKEAKNPPTEIKTDGDLIHIVEKKETLFGISRKYEISVSELLHANDSSIYSLQEGMRIKIPIAKTTNTPSDALIPAERDSLITHEVIAKETLYSIARQYGVKVDSIRNLNNGLPDGLKIGMLIRIPKVSSEYLKLKQAKLMQHLMLEEHFDYDTTSFKKKYVIGLFLPLYLNKNDSIFAERDSSIKTQLYRKANMGYDYYRGFTLAFDSIKKAGLNAELKVFDTENNPSKIEAILASGAADSLDLIFGPFYRSSFERVAAFSKPRGIRTICSVPQSNKILLDNPHVLKVAPSNASQIEKISDFVLEKYPQNKITLIDSRKVRDQPDVELFIDAAQKNRVKNNFNAVDSINVIQLYDIDTTKFSKILNDTAVNVLILPSTDQVYVSEFLAALFKLRNKYKFEVYGLEKWQQFDNLDISYFTALNIRLTSTFYIDYNSPEMMNLSKIYRKTFFKELEYFDVLGFDVGYYFLKMLHENGRFFTHYLTNEMTHQNGMQFLFARPTPNSGFENKGVTIVKIEDYKLIEVE